MPFIWKPFLAFGLIGFQFLSILFDCLWLQENVCHVTTFKFMFFRKRKKTVKRLLLFISFIQLSREC